MPHLRTVDKGTFLLLREGGTSPMRAKLYSLILLVKSLKFRSFRGLRPLGPHQGVALDPDPMPVEEKYTPPQQEFLDPPLDVL